MPNQGNDNKTRSNPAIKGKDEAVKKAQEQTASNDVIQNIVSQIESTESILVALSKNPSVDEMTAAIALTIMLDRGGKHATAIYSGKTPNALEFLEPEKTFETDTNSLQDFIIALNKDKADHLRYKLEGDYVKVYITPYRTVLSEDDLEFSHGDYNVDLVIALNVAVADELDAALSEYGRIMHDATAINITTGVPGKFAELEWSNPAASSISEMVADLLLIMKEKLGELDKEVATTLLTGVVAATDRFSNEKTTPKTMALASKLMSLGADQQLVSENMLKTDEPEQADGNLEIEHEEEVEEQEEQPEKQEEQGVLQIQSADGKNEQVVQSIQLKNEENPEKSAPAFKPVEPVDPHTTGDTTLIALSAAANLADAGQNNLQTQTLGAIVQPGREGNSEAVNQTENSVEEEKQPEKVEITTTPEIKETTTPTATPIEETGTPVIESKKEAEQELEKIVQQPRTLEELPMINELKEVAREIALDAAAPYGQEAQQPEEKPREVIALEEPEEPMAPVSLGEEEPKEQGFAGVGGMNVIQPLSGATTEEEAVGIGGPTKDYSKMMEEALAEPIPGQQQAPMLNQPNPAAANAPAAPVLPEQNHIPTIDYTQPNPAVAEMPPSSPLPMPNPELMPPPTPQVDFSAPMPQAGASDQPIMPQPTALVQPVMPAQPLMPQPMMPQPEAISQPMMPQPVMTPQPATQQPAVQQPAVPAQPVVNSQPADPGAFQIPGMG